MTTKDGYSIAEMLVTMFIVAIVIIAAAPSLGKKKIADRYFNGAKHSIYVCKEKDCIFNPPKGSRNLYIIAVGGGGGGTGSHCSSESTSVSGNYDRALSGTMSTTGGYLYHLYASTGSGSSMQGSCQAYPGIPIQADISRRCRIDYKEKKIGTKKKCDSEGRNCIDVDDIDYITCDYNSGGSWSDKCYGHGYETTRNAEESHTGISGACGIVWVLKPEIGKPNRYCNKKIFGGRGGNGTNSGTTFCPAIEGCLKYDEYGRCTWKDTVTALTYTIGKGAFDQAESGASITAKLPRGKNSYSLDANGNKITKYEYSYGGGAGGALGVHGVGGSGFAGGKHSGMSEEYSTQPVPNWFKGENGQLSLSRNTIKWGDGGYPGETKSAYFKNVTGPVRITIGKGGKGSRDKGEIGTNTVVTAVEGGFGIDTKSIIPSLKNLFDKGSPTGFLIEAEGGKGGEQHTYYESCSSSNYYGILPGKTHPSGSSGGGAGGEGGTIPTCTDKPGSDGQNGIVYIFY